MWQSYKLNARIVSDWSAADEWHSLPVMDAKYRLGRVSSNIMHILYMVCNIYCAEFCCYTI
jgi:hypothetical protein